MSLIVQSAVGTTSNVITGNDFGPGTRGMSSVTATFTKPLTNNNVVLVAISGNMSSLGGNIQLGPPPSFINVTGSGTTPTFTYYVALTFTDSTGRETELGTIAAISLLTGQSISTTPPNPNNLASPGWVTWNIYVGLTSNTLTRQNTVPLLPNQGFNLVTFIAGTNPPSIPIYDTSGLTFNQVLFVPGAGNVGNQAMGFYFAQATPGVDTITFVCGAFNSNPLFGIVCDLDMIICELTPANANHFLQSAFIQQGTSIFDVKLNLTDSSGITRTTDYQSQAQSSEAAGVISPSVGTDYFMALMTGFFNTASPGPPNDPPTITGLTYVPVNNVTSYNGLQLYMWVTFRNSVVPTGGFYVRES